MSTYIAMWSGPRNISTALMRSFENRSDCFVSDEPLYPFFLHKTGSNHPSRDEIIQSGEINYNKIIKYIVGPIPSSKSIWFQKHMAHHISSELNLDWIESMRNCMLIRNPRDVICSYIKKNEIDDINQLGYLQQVDIYNMLNEKIGLSPIVIDAKDLLKEPKKILMRVCENLKITFEEEMLSWPTGARETDGVWGKHWYKQVESSTGFRPYIENKKKIPQRYSALYDECMKHYNFLYQNRITLD